MMLRRWVSIESVAGWIAVGWIVVGSVVMIKVSVNVIWVIVRHVGRARLFAPDNFGMIVGQR